MLITKNTRDEIYYFASLGKEKKMYKTIKAMKDQLDKNQKIIGDKIDQTGIGLCLGDINSINSDSFNVNFLRFLSDTNMKNEMSNKGASLIDGKGSQRVASKIMNYYNNN